MQNCSSLTHFFFFGTHFIMCMASYIRPPYQLSSHTYAHGKTFNHEIFSNLRILSIEISHEVTFSSRVNEMLEKMMKFESSRVFSNDFIRWLKSHINFFNSFHANIKNVVVALGTISPQFHRIVSSILVLSVALLVSFNSKSWFNAKNASVEIENHKKTLGNVQCIKAIFIRK